MLTERDKEDSIVWEVSVKDKQIVFHLIKTLNKTLKHPESYNFMLRPKLYYQIEGIILHLGEQFYPGSKLSIYLKFIHPHYFSI